MSPHDAPDRRDSDPLVIEIETFEHVPAGRGRVLLRVDGRYAERPGKRLLDAMLFVDDGLAIHRHAPLTDPDFEGDAGLDGWLWRAAFDVPEHYLTDARTRFALEAEPGSLFDLPRPAELVPAAAVPIGARAAHVARRYAAAVAILLAVAVAPGGLPASARTEILRVRQPDGTVVYMTTDGKQVAQLPADAVIVDQSAPAPAPAQPQPAPAPAPAAQDIQAGQQPPTGAVAVEQAAPHAKRGTSQKHHTVAARHAAHRHRHRHAAAPLQQTEPDTAVPTAGAAPAPRHHSHHRHQHHHAATHRHQQPPAEQPDAVAAPPVAGDAAPLTSQPGLVAGHGDGTRLEPLTRIATGHHHATTAATSADMPTKGLQPLGALGGATGPAHGPGVGVGTDQSAPAPLPGSVQPLEPVTGGPFVPPASTDGRVQHHSHSHAVVPAPHRSAPAPHPSAPRHVAAPAPAPVTARPLAPMQSLPGPSTVTGVPNFVIQRFHVPPFLLPIYQAAGMQYGIRWEVLAAINEIETDYGRNLNVSSAGALGWMQFMPATWKTYGVDANRDHEKDPYNPVDAIFAAARYLKAAGGDKDVRQAIFAYNHASWYVDSVMLRAKLLAGYPPDFIGSLTGLTEARFPVAARAHYGTPARTKHAKPGQNAANVVASSEQRDHIEIYSHDGAPVVAVNDGVIKAIGQSKKRGNYVVLQDVYGNRYTYSGLSSLSKLYPVPKPVRGKHALDTKPIGAHDPKPTAPASAGVQRPDAQAAPKQHPHAPASHPAPAPAPAAQPAAVKQRLFAHPLRPNAQAAGGFEQLAAAQGGGLETYDGYFAHGIGLNSRNATLKRLKKGAHVIGGTVLGRIGGGDKPHMRFEVRPAGKGAPKIDPKPILDGWKLLASTAVYRASGRNVLYGNGKLSIGETMLLPKALLEQRVLSDPRIQIYAAGRNDIKTGQIDRRVLIVLEYLADSGLHPTVSCLKSGHSLLTSSGNVSEHVSGNAVDISAINGTPILDHQGAGSIAETTVKRLMELQGTMAPHQIISLMDFGQNTLALPDHYNHIHVGFHPLFGANEKLGREVASVLKPRQWGALVRRLGQIQNPSVPTHPSKYAIPDKRRKGE